MIFHIFHLFIIYNINNIIINIINIINIIFYYIHIDIIESDSLKINKLKYQKFPRNKSQGGN